MPASEDESTAILIGRVPRSEQLKQCRRRLPAADRHRSIGRRSGDLAQSTLRSLRAETLRVDHAVTRPDLVDTFSRIEDGECLCRITVHQEDRIAVISARLLAETLGLVPDDAFEL